MEFKKVCDFRSVTSDVLKSHLTDVHVHISIQNVNFGYWEECQVCDLDSVTQDVLKSHTVDVQLIIIIKT